MSAAASPAPAASPANPPAPGACLAPLLRELATGEGFAPSRLPGVRFMRSTIHVPRTPIVYEPCIVLIAQGRKFGHLGARAFVYDPEHYLVLITPMPFECETVGTPAEPVLGLSVGLSPALVADLVLQLPPPPPGQAARSPAVDSAPLDSTLADPARRLLEALRSDADARILGPSLVREITYRALLGPCGPALRTLVAPHSHFGRIARILQRLHTDFAAPHDTSSLAREAGMSPSTFHAHFKAITASSPLRYLKHLRLHQARLLMARDGLTAAGAATRVGYESASQFSREFKRYFGAPPAASATALRASLVRLA